MRGIYLSTPKYSASTGQNPETTNNAQIKRIGSRDDQEPVLVATHNETAVSERVNDDAARSDLKAQGRSLPQCKLKEKADLKGIWAFSSAKVEKGIENWYTRCRNY